jgi:hypothetical protein
MLCVQVMLSNLTEKLTISLILKESKIWAKPKLLILTGNLPRTRFLFLTITLALPSINARLKHFSSFIYRSITNINLFETTPTGDERVQRQQKVYTRIYLIFFIGIMSAIISYNALMERRTSKTHYSPSIVNYKNLYDIYQDGVNCPCTHVSLPYSEFVTDLRVDLFHRVCVSNEINTLLLSGNYHGFLTSREQKDVW